MQLSEVKNDIAKIIYNPEENNLLPSDFLMIEDANQKLVAQIINTQISETSNDNIAVVRLALSIDNDDNLSLYNGYIPAKTCKIIYINSDEILEFIKGSGINIYFGNLSNYPAYYVKPSISILDDYLYIQSDRDNQTETVTYNILKELQNKKQNVLLLDFDGKYDIDDCIRLKVADDFKLPLNIEAFNTILEYDTIDCSSEEKTLIQSIVLEVREYINTLEDKFIPFTSFKNVVNEEFISSPSYGLMYFRNKLWEYAQDSLFAENKDQFEILNSAFKESKKVVIDASEIHSKWYRLIIQAICSFLDERCYFLLSLNDINMDKKSIINLYKKQNIIPVVSTTYASVARKMLKSVCRNQVLCKPFGHIVEDEKYIELLNRINEEEMIIYGQTTLYLPIPAKLKRFNDSTADDLIEYEIKKDVDKLLSSSQTVIPPEAVVQELTSEFIPNNYTIVEEEDLTDSDLDFLDEERNNKLETETVITENAQSTEETKYELFSPVEDTSQNTDNVNKTYTDEVNSDDVDTVQTNIEENDNTQEEIASIDDIIQTITEKAEEKAEEKASDTDENLIDNSENEVVSENNDDIQNSENIQDDESENKPEPEPPIINENINTKKSVELPVYETDTSSSLLNEELPFKVGDLVYHPKHGRGVVEGFANYSNKILFCQIEFENVGRRILDPRISGIEKIS